MNLVASISNLKFIYSFHFVSSLFRFLSSHSSFVARDFPPYERTQWMCSCIANTANIKTFYDSQQGNQRLFLFYSRFIAAVVVFILFCLSLLFFSFFIENYTWWRYHLLIPMSSLFRSRFLSVLILTSIHHILITHWILLAKKKLKKISFDAHCTVYTVCKHIKV